MQKGDYAIIQTSNIFITLKCHYLIWPYYHITTNNVWTFLLRTFPRYYTQIWCTVLCISMCSVKSATAHLCKLFRAVCQKQRCQLDWENSEQDWHTTGQGEREIFVQKPLFHDALNSFFQLGEYKCQRRDIQCESLQPISWFCERTLLSRWRQGTRSEVCIKFAYLISMSFVKAHLAKW